MPQLDPQGRHVVIRAGQVRAKLRGLGDGRLDAILGVVPGGQLVRVDIEHGAGGAIDAVGDKAVYRLGCADLRRFADNDLFNRRVLGGIEYGRQVRQGLVSPGAGDAALGDHVVLFQPPAWPHPLALAHDLAHGPRHAPRVFKRSMLLQPGFQSERKPAGRVGLKGDGG